MHLLMQRAAERDVQLLQAAADGEQRDRKVERAPDQRQGGGVAGRIPWAVGVGRRSTVVVRFDVGRAAGISSGRPPAPSITLSTYLSPTWW